ncbi:hypothetical protein A9498_30695 (plasmid) [Bacillus thuringiensis serovar coreanensis]|nr:hypothetical protein A9498_30695 [Bacillus thuringiensis serovar coreanensis]
MYLYLASDLKGVALDFYLIKSRDKQVPSAFLKVLAFSYVSKPRIINIDKNPTYPVAIQTL